jgi:hypothetical protein
MVPSPLSPYSANGGTSDPARMMRRTTTGRRRELAQILQRLPADDKLRKPHPVPRSPQLSLVVRELQASVSPTPFVADPGVASATASQSCTLQIWIRHRRVDVKSSTGPERTAPRLLLLLGGDLALGRRLLLRGGLRLGCLLHHIALLVRA